MISPTRALHGYNPHSILDALVQARDGASVCVALSGQHGEGRYIVVNLSDGGKVKEGREGVSDRLLLKFMT